MDYLSSKYDVSDFYYFRNQNYVYDQYPKVDSMINVCIEPNGEIISQTFAAADGEAAFIHSAVYMGDFSTMHFGNILIDYMSRLWYQLDATDVKWVYTSNRGNILENIYFKYLLGLLGISTKNIVKIEKPTYFKQLLVPQHAFVHDKYVLPVFSEMYERMYVGMGHDTIPTYDKLYLTRTQLKRHKEIGERRFETFFAANGYKIVALETFSIAQQAYLVRHAKNIVSLEGTHAHSIVWRKSNSGGEYVILRKQKETIPRQMMLNQLYGVPITFIDVFEEPFKSFPISHDRGPFLLKWTDEIERFAKDNNMVIPKECRLGYLRDKVEYIAKCVAYKIWHTLKHPNIK